MRNCIWPVTLLLCTISLCMSLPPTIAARIEKVSVSTTGAQTNLGLTVSPHCSSEGRYVAFVSYASNLVPNDTNGCEDIFVRDRVTGTTERVSVSNSGAQGDESSMHPDISSDGRYVVFESASSTFIPGSYGSDIYIRDRILHTTKLVSVSTSGGQSNNNNSCTSVSADGRYVAWQSYADNLVAGDSNGKADVFVRDMVLNKTVRVSVSSAGSQGNAASGYPSISADGRYVAFESSATNLVSNDINGRDDVFLHDLDTGITEIISVTAGEEQANHHSNGPYVNGDGRYVAFHSYATNLAPGTYAYRKVFVRDRIAGTTELICVSANGQPVNGNNYCPTMSDDGRFVVFGFRAAGLFTADIYIRDRQLGATQRVSESLSGEQANGTSEGCEISSDGRCVAFSSWASNLVTGDTNNKDDIFVRDTTVILASISVAKNLSNGTPVEIIGREVTAAFTGKFYIEESDRSSGIMVESDYQAYEQQMVNVMYGKMSTLSGERCIETKTVIPANGDPVPIRPVGMNLLWLGGGPPGDGFPGITGGFGLKNTGLLVRIWGKVTEIGDDYLYVDDGSHLVDGTYTGLKQNIGVRVICDPTGYDEGYYVLVEGISSCFETESATIARRVLPRRNLEIISGL